jgi:hypothetical protein
LDTKAATEVEVMNVDAFSAQLVNEGQNAV